MLRVNVTSLLICLFTLLLGSRGVAAEQQLIEVRFYHFRSAEKAEKFDSMMKNAALPVAKSEGIGPVGVFKVESSKVLNRDARVVITPYKSVKQMLALREAYAEDPEFWPDAQDYLMQERGDPAYDRVESMLLSAFTGMPELKVPPAKGEKKRRFELRTYKSENEIQGLLKVKMFNDGEIELFEKVGLNAVFYGEAVVASNLPQLTYMVVHEDEEAQAAAWKAFLSHPDWDSLKNDEQYQIIKLKITKHMLVATDYSQIK
ncbi:MAG: NIPSNAP family protein [Planctomycetota bacterium]